MPRQAKRIDGRRNNGGYQPNAGRPRSHLVLSRETAKALHVLTLRLRARRNRSDLTEPAVIAELIERELAQFDAMDTQAEEQSIIEPI